MNGQKGVDIAPTQGITAEYHRLLPKAALMMLGQLPLSQKWQAPPHGQGDISETIAIALYVCVYACTQMYMCELGDNLSYFII